MDENIRECINKIGSVDRGLQSKAFSSLPEATNESVDWACEVWDERFGTARHCQSEEDPKYRKKYAILWNIK